MRSFPGTLLDTTNTGAIARQVQYGRQRGVPWGISESAYAGRDHTLAYQYAPQGVPRLALRRTPPDELVIAPYATALAAQLAPRRAVANLAALQGLGARGSMGFIEALDYTPSRSTLDEPFTPVATSMAHHQGMTIVALANVLRDGVVRRWAMAEPRLEAMVPLLHERAPREVPRLRAPLAGPLPQALRRRAPGLLRPVQPGAAAVEPTQLLSNGRYRVTLRANGAGWSRWGPVGIHRWRDDALRDALGSFFYLRRAAGADLVSLTQHPAPDPDAAYGSTFHADRVCLEATWPDLQAQVTVWVSPEDDIEFRQVELRNLGEAALDLEMISAFELALAEPRADEAHPAFSKLFVHTSWRAAMQAMVFERRPRLAGERAVMAAHFLAASDPPVQAVRVQADRQRWLGRNRGASRPLAAFDAAPVAQGDEGHRPRPGVCDLAACAHPAGREGVADLRHRRHRQRRRAQRGHRQVPPARPRSACVADVGHADGHPPARAGDRCQRLRRDPDPDLCPGADAHRARAAGGRPRRQQRHRPPPAVAIRHLWRPAHRAGLRPGGAGPGVAALAGPGASAVVLGRRRLRPRGAQRRTGVLRDGAAA
jgi:cyclic beta-1,2-glucan synthetase